MCESSKLPMFMLLLLIMGSHVSKCEPITFVFSVTIVIELSCVMLRVPISCWVKPEKRSQASTSSTMKNFYFMERNKSNGISGMRKELDAKQVI